MSELVEPETKQAANRLTGIKTFMVMWFGQFISLLGSGLTAFAIPIWIFGETERVQELALLTLAFLLPAIAMSPVAGALVDRHNRKFMMILSDLVAGLTTLVILFLITSGTLQVWQLYITTAINGAFYTFQWPAYSSAISVMIPKEQYGRANGLTSLGRSGSEIFAPVLAGALLGIIGLRGILLIDVATFVFAIATLLFIYIPQPPRTEAGKQGSGNIWQESAFGFHYILERPGLLGLQSVFLVCNFLSSLAMTTLAAMILFRTDQNAIVFAWVSSAGAIGGLAGGLLMSAWGGPRRRVHGVLLSWAMVGWLGFIPLGAGRIWPAWAVGLFVFLFAVPIMNGSNQAIWQAKVAPDVQGRVFSIRRLLAWISLPMAKLIAIPLADKWLEPAMREGGLLIERLGWLVGVGPGAGTALLFIFSGVAIPLAILGAYRLRLIRDVEDLLPDHDASRM